MLGIVILNYNSYQDLIYCVESVFLTYNSLFHIYIVDNKSSDNSYEQLFLRYENNCFITVTRNEENNGYSAGNNIGIKQAIEDGCIYILICNPDIIFLPNTIKRMVNGVDNKTKCLICPKINNSDNTLAYVHHFKRVTLKEKYLLRTFLKKFNLWGIADDFYGKKYSDDHEVPIYAPSGCCFLVSQKAFKIIFPLDENLFMYSEEYIIGDKLFNAGLFTIYDSKAVVIHKEKPQTHTPAFSYIHGLSSEMYFILKFRRYHFIKYLPLFLYRILGYIIRCLYCYDYRIFFKLFKSEIKSRLKSICFTT